MEQAVPASGTKAPATHATHAKEATSICTSALTTSTLTQIVEPGAPCPPRKTKRRAPGAGRCPHSSWSRTPPRRTPLSRGLASLWALPRALLLAPALAITVTATPREAAPLLPRRLGSRRTVALWQTFCRWLRASTPRLTDATLWSTIPPITTTAAAAACDHR